MSMRRSFLWLLKLALVVSTANAATDTYVVRNIHVKAKAASANAAKTKAIALGRRKALLILASRISGDDDLPDFSNLKDKDVENLVRDYEVTRQKNSHVSYMATLNFRFDEAAVRKYLKTINYSGTIERKDSLVVIPVFETAEERKLWEADNPWFAAWSNHKNFRTAHPLIIPMRDLSDISEFSPEQAVEQDVNALDRLVRRYGAGGALIAIARKGDGGNIDIAVTLSMLDGTLQTQTLTVTPKLETTPGPATWGKAVDRTVETIKKLGRRKPATPHFQPNTQESSLPSEKGMNSPENPHPDLRAQQAESQDSPSSEQSSSQNLHVTVPLAALNTWTYVQRVLNDIGPITKVQLKSMSNKVASVEMEHSGSLPALKSALGARGLQLSQGTDHRWTLSMGTNPKP